MQQFELRKQSAIQKRKIIYAGTRKQPDKMIMIKLSEQKFSIANVGDTVRLRIPAIDRTHRFSQHVSSNKGFISGRFERKEFEVCEIKFLKLDDIPENEICVRKYSEAVSMFGGEGHKHCNCIKKCDSNRCLCKKKQNYL